MSPWSVTRNYKPNNNNCWYFHIFFVVRFEELKEQGVSIDSKLDPLNEIKKGKLKIRCNDNRTVGQANIGLGLQSLCFGVRCQWRLKPQRKKKKKKRIMQVENTAAKIATSQHFLYVLTTAQKYFQIWILIFFLALNGKVKFLLLIAGIFEFIWTHEVH